MTQRTVIAMQYGDNCWLKGLQSKPELNGLRVVLEKWVDDRQRWKCKPVGWKHEEPFIAVKPKNLSKDPVPRWAVRTTSPVKPGEQCSPDNTAVFCANAKDFRACEMEVPPAPPLGEVYKTAARQSKSKEQRDNDDRERAEIGAKLEALMKREGELQKIAIGPETGRVGTICMEDTLRHMLCQQELLKTQINLFARTGRNDLVQQGAAQLREHMDHVAPVKAAWDEKGMPELDFWEDPEETPENDPELRKWAQRAAARAQRVAEVTEGMEQTILIDERSTAPR